MGSGKYWTRHINQHGKEHVVTLWYQLFDSQELLTDFALLFSEHWDIVKSKDWANLMPENGLTGYVKGGRKPPMSEEQKAKISAVHKGRKNSPEHNAKISASHTGRKQSEEHRKKSASIQKGRIRTPEQNATNSAAQRGISKNKGTVSTRRGVPRSQETKDKISASHKARKKQQYEDIMQK